MGSMPSPVEVAPGKCDVCGASSTRVVLHGRDRRHGTVGRFEVHQCLDCGLGRTVPRPSEPGNWYPRGEYMNHTERRDLVSRTFAAVLRGTASGRWPDPVRRLALLAVPAAQLGGALARGARVLDVGCGSGHAVAALRAAGVDAHGVEPDPGAVKVAHAAGLTSVMQGTLDDVPSREGAWDVVRFWHTLEHVPSPMSALRRVHSLLSTRGRIVIGVPNFNSAGRLVFGPDWDGLELPRHLHHFTRSSLRRALREAGFSSDPVRSAPIMGVLAGSIDARTRRDDRQRTVASSAAVQLALHPIELVAAAVGRGDGLIAVGRRD